MDWKNPFRKGPKSLDGPAGDPGSSDASPLGDAIGDAGEGALELLVALLKISIFGHKA